MAHDPEDPKLTFSRFVGLLLGMLVFDLARIFAVAGCLVTGLVCLFNGWGTNFPWDDPGGIPGDWRYLAIAGATFVGMTIGCRR